MRVLHQIGAGGVGPVFRGEDPETRRPVVIKVLRVGLPPERAAIVGAALNGVRERLAPHPALCPILESGVQEAEPFVVFGFVDGDSLDVALREFGPANISDALPRLRLLADALDSAATAGVVHGSLHLRDIIVSPEHTVLTGIGVASVLERVGVRPPVRRPYSAPEIVHGHGVSPAGDQFALAAIAHEWLSGRRIAGPGGEGYHLPGSSAAGTEAVAAVFCRALDELADARYATATAFVDALGDVSDALAPRARIPRRKPPAAEAPRLAFDGSDDTRSPDGPTGPVAPPRRSPAARVPSPPPAPPAAAPAMSMATAPMAAAAEEPPSAFVADDEDLEGDPMAIDPDDRPLSIDAGLDAIDLPVGRIAPAGDTIAALEAAREAARDDAPDMVDTPMTGPDEFESDELESDETEPDEIEPDEIQPGEIERDEIERDERDEVEPDDDESADRESDDIGSADGEPDEIEATPATEPPDEPVAPPVPPPLPRPRLDTISRLDQLTGMPRAAADVAPRARTPVPDHPMFGERTPSLSQADAASDGPRPLTWVLGLLALALVVVGGGYLLVRWGTPGGPTVASIENAPPESSPSPTSAAPPRVAVPGSAAAPGGTPPAKADTPPAPAPSEAPASAAPERPAPAPVAPAAPKVSAPPAQSPPPKAPVDARPGRLLVRSNPAGAEVFVNGTRRGVTPLALRDLPLGGYDLRVNRAGFTAAEQRVTLDAGRPSRTVEVALRRAAAAAVAPVATPAPVAGTGSLLVDSRPPGARVTVDGRDVGVTPVTIPVAAGEHSVRFELAGYQAITTTARVEPGARARVAVSLTIIERPED